MLPAWRTSSVRAQLLMIGSPATLVFGSQRLVGSQPPPGLDEHEQLAAVARGVRERDAEARDGPDAGHHLHEATPIHHALH